MGKPKRYFDFISHVYNMARGAILFSMQHSPFTFLRSGGLRLVDHILHYAFLY